jgi:PHD/YefM family antitoxin component YafN of YafNO toxin-antitoxin module
MANMSKMAKAATSHALTDIARVPASDVKRLGWRGVARVVADRGAVLVTNHDRPEAVILSSSRYETLLATSARADARVEVDLDTLRRRFDERLASLEADDAAERLRGVMRKPLRLRGRVVAGTRA